VPFALVSLLPEARWNLLPQGVGQRSVFWHAATSTNTLLLTWQNACVGRDVNCPTNFQAELFPDGRLAYRYPGVERSYTPIDPCDYDGDGLANEIDPDPLTANGNCFGQGEAWLRATFTNADEMVGAGYTNWISGWVGANVQNGRYQLKVRFTGAPQRPLRLKVGRFAVMVDSACELVFPLEVDEAHALEMSRECDGVEYVWDDGYTGTETSFDYELVRPTPDDPGMEAMRPRLVIAPRELTAGEARDGASLTPYLNRPSTTYEWRERFGEAEFEEGTDGTVTVSGIGGGTVITAIATSGTNTTESTVTVQNPTGAGSAPPAEEPPRTDASIIAVTREIEPEANGVETMPVRWIGFSGTGSTGESGRMLATNGVIVIPARRTCFIGAFVSTTEYPFWTGRIAGNVDSRYNDSYYWRVRAGRDSADGFGNVGDLHAMLGSAHAADDMSPVVFSGGRFFTAGATDLNVNFEMSVRNADDALRPTAVKLGVFPMTLTQSNYPLNTNTTYSATDWGVHTNQLIKSQEVAYITGEPSAPELSVKLQGLPNWITNSWSASLVTERSERGTRDDRLYAQTNLLGGTSLDIKAWMDEIVGGKMSLTSMVQNASAHVTEFYIRGKNPLDEDARAYIDAHVDAEFSDYAWMIAKHESRQRRRVYNQFNSGGTTRERPNWGTPYGWGMCQIDKGEHPGCTTAEVYDWHTNVLSMSRVLEQKRSRFQEILGLYRAAYSQDSLTRWFEPDNITTNVEGMVLTARQWAIITLYNGAGGSHPLPFIEHERESTPIHFDPATTNWVLYTNVNDYVPSVLRDRNIEVNQ